MSNIKILFRNILDYSTTTMIEENNVTNMGQSKLTLPGKFSRFRSDGELAPEFKFNLGGESVSVSDVFVFHTNLETDATIRTILYDADSQGGSTLLDTTSEAVLISGNTEFMEDNKHVHQTFTTETGVMSGKWELNDSGNPDSYIQCSRAFVGTCWEPEIGVFEEGSDWGWDDTASQIRTQGNSLRSTGGGTFPALKLNFGILTLQEALDLNDHCRYVGFQKDFAVAFYSGVTGQAERDFIMQCKLKSKPQIKPKGGNYYTAVLNLVGA